jgi:hypothetical protein
MCVLTAHGLITHMFTPRRTLFANVVRENPQLEPELQNCKAEMIAHFNREHSNT